MCARINDSFTHAHYKYEFVSKEADWWVNLSCVSRGYIVYAEALRVLYRMSIGCQSAERLWKCCNLCVLQNRTFEARKKFGSWNNKRLFDYVIVLLTINTRSIDLVRINSLMNLLKIFTILCNLYNFKFLGRYDLTIKMPVSWIHKSSGAVRHYPL